MVRSGEPGTSLTVSLVLSLMERGDGDRRLLWPWFFHLVHGAIRLEVLKEAPHPSLGLSWRSVLGPCSCPLRGNGKGW